MEKVKRDTATSSVYELEEMLDALCPKACGEEISVISTIPQGRKNHIYGKAGELVPRHLKHQILPNGAVVTEAIELCGIESRRVEGIMPCKDSIEIDEDFIETDFYKIHINRQTKRIVSLIDKETGTEYIDNQARFELGQFVYAYAEHKTDSSLSFEIPKKTDFKLYEGDVAYALIQKGYEEQSGAVINAQFVFYKHERAIDVDLSYENATGLIGDFYDRYKKNYFFAFPFKLENPKFYTEMPVGEKREDTDYIPLSANDFSVTQNWVAIDGENAGVAIYTRDMPVLHLGKIKYNQFNRDFSEDKAHVYLYASSNRCNNLIYTSIEECQAQYHLSILLYNGRHNDIVPKWSNENDHRLIVSSQSILNEKTITLDKSNVKLVSLKKSEKENDALVLRFVETEGKEAECKLSLFFSPQKAEYASNDEIGFEKITLLKDNTVSFNAQPYSYTTIKVYGDFEI